MDRLENMERKPQWDNQQQGTQIRNPNTGKSRESAPDQQIRPPFQENYGESSYQNEYDEDTINIMVINDDNIVFIT